jgi:hypothetical protein
MAFRKMTFTLPEELASRFVRRVPARFRSQYVAEALNASLGEQENQLIAACEIANADPDVLALEREFDALPAEVTEPWLHADAPQSAPR